MTTAHAAILDLLERHGPDKTICPSEAAKALMVGEENWRTRMVDIHTAVDALYSEGLISLSWKGDPLSQRRGAYRIARRSPRD